MQRKDRCINARVLLFFIEININKYLQFPSMVHKLLTTREIEPVEVIQYADVNFTLIITNINDSVFPGG